MAGGGLKDQQRAASRESAAGKVPEALESSSKAPQGGACWGVGEMSQLGIEIETSNGIGWVLPYSDFGAFKYCRGREGAKDTVIWCLGSLKIFLSGRGLRQLLGPAREQRITYLRPLPPVASKNAPESAEIVVISKIAVIKQAKGDPEADHVQWDGEDPKPADDDSPAEDESGPTMNEKGAIERSEVE